MGWGIPAAIVGGAAINALSGNKAADSAENAADAAADAQLYMYKKDRKSQKKWRAAGKKGLRKLQNKNNGIGSFEFNLEDDPIYNFAIDEAMRGTGRQYAAQGMGNSGNVLAALNDRAVGVASQYQNDAFNRQWLPYGDEMNRWQSLAGLGQTSVGQTGNAGMNAANGMGSAYGMEADAAGTRWGAYNNAAQQGISNYLTYDYLNPGTSAGGSRPTSSASSLNTWRSR